MPINDFDIIDQGADGIIYVEKLKSGNYSNKIIKKMLFNSSVDINPSILNELIILNNLNHTNIIKMIEYNVNMENGEFNIVLPNCGEPLSSYLLKKNLTDHNINQIICQILSAINYLHENNYVHGDISLKNILVKEFGATIKISIIDFSTTTKEQRFYRSSYSPTYYVCPYELLDTNNFFRKEYPKSTDIFSLGCILYFILTKNLLFEGLDTDSQYNDILKKLKMNSKSLFKGLEHHFLTREIRKMIQINPARRPSISSIIENLSKHIKFNTEKKINKILITEKNKIDINKKIELIKVILEYCIKNCISYETIFMTIDNLSKLNNYNYYNGIIMFWLATNIIENKCISVTDIYYLIKIKIPSFQENKKNIILKKLKLIKKLNYKIDNPTIYQNIYSYEVNHRKNIIKDALTIITFTDKTCFTEPEINELVYINTSNKRKDSLEKKYNLIKSCIYSGKYDDLNYYNIRKYNYGNINNLFDMLTIIDKAFTG